MPGKTIGIIPARYGSTRFRGKPLAQIAGKPMIQWTYENAKKAKELDDLVVATDNVKIEKAVQSFGGKVMMTGVCSSGSDRCWEVVWKLKEFGLEYDYVINIQGDEPLVNPDHIDTLVKTLKMNQEAPMVSLVAPLTDEYEARSRTCTKVIFDRNFYAIYYSRALIPHSKSGLFHLGVDYYKNCGMYGFRSDFLELYAKTPLTSLQKEEDLEQLKAIELGFRIKVALVDEAASGVDLPDQIEKIEKIIHRLQELNQVDEDKDGES